MRWIVRAGDGRTVGEVLARAGADADAVREGRVFVERERIRRSDRRVHPGDEVTVASPRGEPIAAARVLFRAGDLVAVDKPAGVPTIADHAGAAHSLAGMLAIALSTQVRLLHPTSRLDRDVSGVVVFALSPVVAKRLLRARAEGQYGRHYVAIAACAPSPDRGTWDAPVGRSGDPRLRAVGGRDAVPARTRYAAVGKAGAATMLAVSPLTGRTHQIRVHASNAGAPLLGDRAYGGPSRLTLSSGRVLEPGRIALHAARVVVPGEDGEVVVVASPLPPDLLSLWSALGGDPGAWEVAVAAALDRDAAP
jgi:RluA family pseudouridine synthase